MATAYARHQAKLKQDARKSASAKRVHDRKLRKDQKYAKDSGKCGALKKNGEFCGRPAGWGTANVGLGPCRNHGGMLPPVVAHHAKNRAILMGAPKEINPLDALIWCIKLTAGEVEFCTQQMEVLDEDAWTESTIVGKQLHLWAKERQRAVDRLAKFSKDALALGIADRAVRLAEQYGASIARYTKGLLDDLELTPEQVKKAPLIVRKHLALLEGGSPVSDEDRRDPIAAIPRRVA